MVLRPGRVIGYEEFSSRVRRHRPSELLLTLARSAIENGDPEVFLRRRMVLPWALAAAAKESIAAGNEHRDSGVEDRDIVEICARFNGLRDPLGKSEHPMGSLASFLTRTAHEQFPHQMTHFEELARSIALFEEEVGLHPQSVLKPSLWDEIFGCSVAEWVRVAMILYVGAMKFDGYFDFGRVDSTVFELSSPELVRSLLEKSFSEEFGAVQRRLRTKRPAGEARRYEFNPLFASPILRMPDGSCLAPVPQLVLHRASSTGFFYATLEQLDSDEGDIFCRELGEVFEQYVGRQLSQTSATVLPEIKYRVGKNLRRSADWIAIWPDFVLLVEAKTSRLNLQARMGDLKEVENCVKRSIGEGMGQLRSTAQLIRDQHDAFRHIPDDRPIAGLVVTLEPYFIGNSSPYRAYVKDAGIPAGVASSRGLEYFVSMETSGMPQTALLDVLLDDEKRTWELESSLPAPEGRLVNAVLDTAWNKLSGRPRIAS